MPLAVATNSDQSVAPAANWSTRCNSGNKEVMCSMDLDSTVKKGLWRGIPRPTPPEKNKAVGLTWRLEMDARLDGDERFLIAAEFERLRNKNMTREIRSITQFRERIRGVLHSAATNLVDGETTTEWSQWQRELLVWHQARASDVHALLLSVAASACLNSLATNHMQMREIAKVALDVNACVKRLDDLLDRVIADGRAKKRRRKKRMRYIVDALRDAYPELTGCAPKRRHNAVLVKDYGDFHSLCKAVVATVLPRSGSVDHTVRQSLVDGEVNDARARK